MSEETIARLKQELAGKTAEEIEVELAASRHGPAARDPALIAAYLVRLAAS